MNKRIPFSKLGEEIKKDIKSRYTKRINKVLEEYKDYLLEEIPKTILEGRSPVKQAKTRFEKYSVSYSNAIKKKQVGYDKKLRPVNLKLSGELIKSFKIILDKNAQKLTLVFDNWLALIHTIDGVGKAKTKRKMLPQGGERFNGAIEKGLFQIFRDVFSK